MILNAERCFRRPRIDRPMSPRERDLLWTACRHGIAYAGATSKIAAGRLKDRKYVTLDVQIVPDALRGRHQIQYILRPTAAGREVIAARSRI